MLSLSTSCGSSAICTAANLSLNALNEPNEPIEFKLLFDDLRLRLEYDGDLDNAGEVDRLALAGTGRRTFCFFMADRENLGAFEVGELKPSESASEPEGEAALP